MIRGAVVVDASAVVEFLVRLRWADEAERLFQAAGDGDVDLIAPDLVFLDSVSALRKLVQRKAIDTAARRPRRDHARQPADPPPTAGTCRPP